MYGVRDFHNYKINDLIVKNIKLYVMIIIIIIHKLI